MKIFNEIKWAYQRVVRGYDDRIFWGVDEYFEQFLPAIKQFCKGYLEHDYCDLNHKRKKVMQTTIKLIEIYEEQEYASFDGVEAEEMWEYIGKYLTWYWD
jgi:hypothetical protein